MTRALDRARHVDVEHPPVGVRRHLEERAAHHDAGIVDQDVQATEAVDGRGDERARIALPGHVAVDRECLGAQPSGLRHDLVGLPLARQVVHRHPRALSRKGQRDRASEAAAGARHQREAPVEPSSTHYCAARPWLVPSQNFARSIGFGHQTSFLPSMRWMRRSTMRMRDGRPMIWGCPSQL